MKKLYVILDPAHGSDVLGKASPDGVHKEYLWSRDICQRLKKELDKRGFIASYTTISDKEPGLTARKNTASKAVAYSGQTKFLLSLHNNAAGDGSKWMNARGVEIFTTRGQTKSDEFATIIIEQLMQDFPELKYRTDYSDGDPDKEENFTVLMGSGYYAALLEWLFQDNKEDFELLRDENYNSRLVKSLCDALEKINDTLK